MPRNGRIRHFSDFSLRFIRVNIGKLSTSTNEPLTHLLWGQVNSYVSSF